MKIRRMKRFCTVTALGLLISMALVLGGCGNNDKPQTTEKAAETTEKETTTEEAAAPEETTAAEAEAEKEDEAAPAEAEAEKEDEAAPAEADAEDKAEDAEAEAPAEGEDAEAAVQGEGDSAEGEGDSAAEGEGDSAEGEGGPGGGDSGSSSSEPVEVPAMAGEVVYKFILEKEVSTSLGGMEQFTAYIELYDTPNEDGKTALLGVCQGSSVSFTTATWSEDEDGTLKMPVDEFTIYSTKDIDGVKTFCNIRYNAGMMSNGVVDIPMVDVETPTPVLGSEAAAEDGDAPAEVQGEGESEGGDAASEGGEGDSAEGDSAEGGDAASEGDAPQPEGGEAPEEPVTEA